MAKRITATTAAKRFREVLNEVELSGEVFEVERHGKLVAEIRPAHRTTFAELVKLLKEFPHDPEFAKDVEEARRIDAEFLDEDPWERWSTPR